MGQMDDSTREKIAEIICGDGSASKPSPKYRSGSDLTGFFRNAGFPQFVHHGETRRWWTHNCLLACTEEEVWQVIRRLASPTEYADDKSLGLALEYLNIALRPEGLKVRLPPNGKKPIIEEIQVDYSNVSANEKSDQEFTPLPPPNFEALQLAPGIGTILSNRWEEAQKCVNADAHLAATILMGTLLEGMLFGVCLRFPKEANTAASAPKDKDGKVKRLETWTLSQMIDVAHHVGWLDLDVKRFSHSLREFRNIIHPYEHLANKVAPDIDTCRISWAVVTAAANDLAKRLLRG